MKKITLLTLFIFFALEASSQIIDRRYATKKELDSLTVRLRNLESQLDSLKLNHVRLSIKHNDLVDYTINNTKTKRKSKSKAK